MHGPKQSALSQEKEHLHPTFNTSTMKTRGQGDPPYRVRRTLHTGAGLLTDTQAERLENLFADERHAPVKASWGVYQRLIQAYRTEDPGLGKHLMRRLISSLRQAVPAWLEEVGALARTLTERSTDILAYFDHPGSSNGPTPGRQRTTRAPTRNSPGIQKPDALHHPQPHPRRPPQGPPDSNHLRVPISSTYHTLKCEEPPEEPPKVASGASRSLVTGCVAAPIIEEPRPLPTQRRTHPTPP